MAFYDNFVDSVSDAFDNLVDSVKEFYTVNLNEILVTTFAIIGVTQKVYKTEVSTSKIYENSNNNAISKVIFRHAVYGESLAEQLTALHISGGYKSLTDYIQYGKDHYVHGLPTATIIKSDNKEQEVASILPTIDTNFVSVSSVVIAGGSINDAIREYLQNNYEYYVSTDKFVRVYPGAQNILGYDIRVWFSFGGYTINAQGNYEVILSVPGGTIIRKEYEVTRNTVNGTTTITTKEKVTEYVFPTFELISSYYSPGETITQEPGDPVNDGVTLTTINNQDGGTYTIPLPETIVVPAIDTNESYIRVLYVANEVLPGGNPSPQDVDRLWLYARTDPTYPTLQVIINNSTDDTEVAPIATLKSNYIYSDSNKVSATYTTTKRLLNLVGINLDRYIDVIRDSRYPDNISDAFIFFGLNIYTDTQAGLSGLYKLFSELQISQGTDKATYVAATNKSGLSNYYAVREENFNCVLSFNYIDTVTVPAVLGDVGEYGSVISINGSTEHIPPDHINIFGAGLLEQSTISYWKQISSTHVTIIEVHGPKLVASVPISNGDYRANEYVLVDESETTNRSNFTIPLSRMQLDELDINTQEAMIQESATLCVYSSDSTEIEWYQTAGFANLIDKFVNVIEVAGIASFITTLGTSTSVLSGLAKIAAQLVTQHVLNTLLKEALSHNISNEAKIAIVALYTYGTYLNFSGGSNSGESFADTLLLSVNAVNYAAQVDIALQQEELQEEIDAYRDLLKDRNEELQDAWNIFNDTADNLELLYGSKRNIIDPYETPEDFYARTIHIANPGVLSLSYADNYVENSLALPTHRVYENL